MSGVDYLIGEAKMYKNGTSQIYKRGGRGVCVGWVGGVARGAIVVTHKFWKMALYLK